MNDPKEAIKFYRVQLNRCKINLIAAKQRNDERAVQNIQRKIEIYDYTIKELCKIVEVRQ